MNLDDVKRLFRESMSQLASGVSIVTTEIDGRPWGLTISACCSISMDPPLIMISLATKTASSEGILGTNRFGVSILAENQLEIAKAGAKPGEPKFFEKYTEPKGTGNFHVVKEALAHVNCEVYNTVIAGDHTIFIGEVKEVIVGGSQTPLLHYQRQFGSFSNELKMVN
jgi:flavin reductase ActVB